MADSRLSQIFKSELKGGKGTIGGLASALGKTTLEKIDPRNILFGGKGVGSVVGQRVFGRGYKGAPERVSKISQELADKPSLDLQPVVNELKILNKSNVVLPLMARDMNIMRQNIVKLVKTQGVKPSTRADAFFLKAGERESAIESQRQRLSAQPQKTEVAPAGLKETGFDIKKILTFLGVGAIVTLITTLPAIFSAIKERISSAIQKTKNFFEDLVDGIKDIGTFISTGFANLIDNIKSGVKLALANVIETATSFLPDFIKEKLNISGTVSSLRESAAVDKSKIQGRTEERARSIEERDAKKQALRSELSAQGITDPRAQANIMAQVQRESGFNPQSENLNYSGEKLFQLYGEGNTLGNKARFKTLEEAKALASQGPEAIGNLIYGGRMGNAADEGFKYRGRGLIQLTGKANYERYGKMIGEDLVNNPDLANDPQIASKLAAVYFKDKQSRGINLSNIESVNKSVGFAGGAEESKRRAQLAEAFFKEPTKGSVMTTASTVIADAKSVQSQSPVIVNAPTTNNVRSGGNQMPAATADAYNRDFNDLLLRTV